MGAAVGAAVGAATGVAVGKAAVEADECPAAGEAPWLSTARISPASWQLCPLAPAEALSSASNRRLADADADGTQASAPKARSWFTSCDLAAPASAAEPPPATSFRPRIDCSRDHRLRMAWSVLRWVGARETRLSTVQRGHEEGRMCVACAVRGRSARCCQCSGRRVGAVAGPASPLTWCSLPGGQPAADLEPLVAELSDALHDDLVLPACPRAALLLSKG